MRRGAGASGGKSGALQVALRPKSGYNIPVRRPVFGRCRPREHCLWAERGSIGVDVQVGDKLIMKKNHPCGCNEFWVRRVGMDFKIECAGCGHLVMVPRAKVEKNIKKILREESQDHEY